MLCAFLAGVLPGESAHALPAEPAQSAQASDQTFALLWSHAGIFRRPRRAYDDLPPAKDLDERDVRRSIFEYWGDLHVAHSRRASDIQGHRLWILYGDNVICEYRLPDFF